VEATYEDRKKAVPRWIIAQADEPVLIKKGWAHIQI